MHICADPEPTVFINCTNPLPLLESRTPYWPYEPVLNKGYKRPEPSQCLHMPAMTYWKLPTARSFLTQRMCRITNLYIAIFCRTQAEVPTSSFQPYVFYRTQFARKVPHIIISKLSELCECRALSHVSGGPLLLRCGEEAVFPPSTRVLIHTIPLWAL